ncbi:MAG: hypothetical protein A2431_02660 [Candidatus Zambryskibacteria bacterium RIFOXYC1_FULL_39_10]|uniref:Uncharacterized protein n=1 Tax=Candidatus Zambryskibacteria bacterium RIFOXYC1_FULL_39_10 TaxID=1802779 RepID=A0A1G2V1H0_9BACT|nr:MAG: hypothetical protein A2431_02660 [Candidatus Zambryskibacteria bacterium RIFOXYC1_FULL_39_10]OHB16552.1 MAG: hypothetical protein A2605_03475 [Candidatus Zambryskibacteria bacterium RIFOXYD1_FULL_39_35]
MSIKKLVAEKIEKIRKMIAVWDSPATSIGEKAEVAKAVMVGDPNFWIEITKRASAPKRNKVAKTAKVAVIQTAPEPVATTTTKVVAVQKAPISTAVRSTPAKPVPATAPARTLKVQPKVAGTSVFAAKLNGAAKEVGLENHTPLGRLQDLLKTDGRKGEYWKELRELLGVCLQKKLIQEVSDWKLLVAKMKKNLFFSGKKGQAFLAQCPREGVEDLLLSDDGLWNLIEALKTEGEINDSTPFHLEFMLDACAVVGKEAKELLIDCKQAVNYMKQIGFVPRDHWLVQKVAAMKAPIPPQSVSPVSETSVNEAAVDHKLDKIQQVVETATIEVPAEKPETLGPAADAQFAQAMMSAAGEFDMLAGIPDEELERLTTPTLAVN